MTTQTTLATAKPSKFPTFSMPSLRLIPKGEKSDSFSDLAMDFYEGRTLKDIEMKKPPKPPKPVPSTSPPVEPPAGWEQKTGFGFMGFDATPAGRLVRLADVLRWMGTHPSPKPHKAALDALCDAMPGDVMQWLYQLQPSDYATPVPSDSMFGGRTVAQIDEDEYRMLAEQQTRARESWVKSWGGFRAQHFIANGKITTQRPNPVEPGLPALLQLIRGGWRHEKFNRAATVAIQDDPRLKLVNLLAIPIDKAAQHWGYGQVLGVVVSEPVTFANLVALRKAEPGTIWTRAMVEILRAELKARQGQRGIRKSVGSALDISPSRIGELLSPDWQGSKKRENPPALRSVQG